ncbi:lytic murein transglycosylase [Pseudolysinimonas sp.]|uniref:lytic murein transglycosylase n=1 Tax=Pseudolysinimonas sp. TaxID=2680009 RepID=UPI00286C9252|nr:lytic murein transglycosylase [Pseudolysinimonas sp.]
MAAVVVALALVVAAVLVFLAPREPGMPGLSPVIEEPAPTWAPPAAAPVAAATPAVGNAGLVDADWLASTSAATGIPERALGAYVGAALAKAASMPECGLSWNTIAGIGATESDHGRHGGSEVGSDGTVSPPIYGVPLAGGEGIEHIPDSDGGALDGDSEFDRAVGPFQLIPQTWRNWHTDASGDGVEDPHNIDDAAMATANYLCRVSIGIDTEQGWIAAVSGFNSPQSYRDTVARYAVRYAEATSAG